MLENIKISHRLWLMSGLAGLLFMTAVVIAWYELADARDSLKHVYEDSAEGLYQLDQIDGLQRENYTQVLLAFQHDPAGRLVAVHDHPISLHFEAVAKNRETIQGLWDAYMATPHTEKEKSLVDDYLAKRKLSSAKLNAAMDAIRAGDYSNETMAAYLKAGREERKAVQEALNKLLEFQIEVARTEYERAEGHYSENKWVFSLMLLIGLVGVLGTAWATIGRIKRSLGAAGAAARAIAAGDLTYALPESGKDELGELVGQLAIMQALLHE
ncbi:MAG: HAMP domain-containing protein, partial [Thiobacillus sp.]|nr:HAMP domain-containing protein [Thiobacillus sp.]